MMYQINILNEKTWDWEQLTFNDKPMLFSSKSTLIRALRNNLGVKTQILYNDWFLVDLNGSLEQLNWFMENHNRLLNATNKAINCQKKYEISRCKSETKQFRNYKR